MGRLKFVMLIFPVIALCLLFWPAGRAFLKKLFVALLWSFCAVSAGTGVVIFVDAKGSLQAILGGLLLWVFSAYAAYTAKSVSKRS